MGKEAKSIKLATPTLMWLKPEGTEALKGEGAEERGAKKR
jgi:hypothetical protein